MTKLKICSFCQGTGIVKWTISGILNGEYYCLHCEKGKQLHEVEQHC